MVYLARAVSVRLLRCATEGGHIASASLCRLSACDWGRHTAPPAASRSLRQAPPVRERLRGATPSPPLSRPQGSPRWKRHTSANERGHPVSMPQGCFRLGASGFLYYLRLSTWLARCSRILHRVQHAAAAVGEFAAVPAGPQVWCCRARRTTRVWHVSYPDFLADSTRFLFRGST